MNKWDLSFFCVVMLGAVILALLVRVVEAEVPLLSIIFAPIFTLTFLWFYRRHWQARIAKFEHGSADLRAQSLLHSFEESGHGWFWETDCDGKIRYLSDVVLQRANVSQDMISEYRLTDFIAGYGHEDDNQMQRTIGFHLATHTSFKDLQIKAVAEGERWWSLSGSPVFDTDGAFRGFRGSGTDLTDIKKSRDKITRLAKYDMLTQLANRPSMNDLLQQALRTYHGARGKCSVMLLDLDKFKQVNDTFGHLAGDELLKIVAERLSDIVVGIGQVGRLGGDEFQIILPKMTAADRLVELAEQIIDRLSEPYSLNFGQVRIGVSIGIVVVDEDDIDPDDIIRNADLALYAAKDAGRGVAHFYEPALLTKASERITLEEELRVALASDQLFLVYQPVIDVATEAIAGFEVLTRWKHPSKGMISPDKFISVAEETGLIEMIGDWALRMACAQLASWDGDLKIAINVSPRQFRSGNLPQTVMNAIASNGLKAEQIELEITESVFLEGDEADVAMFEQLKRIGVRLALDDFGTGYSALGYLQKAPFDKIKIDQSFVRGATLKNSISDAIISSIVTLAQALGMDTTAEGAENLDELELIRKLGCSHVQGYIYSKPVTADQATQMLRNHRLEMRASDRDIGRENRRKALHRISIIHEGVTQFAIVRNISSTGAMIEAPIYLPASAEIKLAFTDGVSIDAKVRWCEGDRIGVEFIGQVDHMDLKRRSFVSQSTAIGIDDAA